MVTIHLRARDVPFGYFHRGILADLAVRAAARLKVDQGERLTMAEIALLLDVREPTVITNAHRKNFPTVEDENRRYAEPAEVLPWMLKQGYVPTKGLPGASESAHKAEPADAIDDLVFVPVARDGTWFGPDCRASGRSTQAANRRCVLLRGGRDGRPHGSPRPRQEAGDRSDRRSRGRGVDDRQWPPAVRGGLARWRHPAPDLREPPQRCACGSKRPRHGSALVRDRGRQRRVRAGRLASLASRTPDSTGRSPMVCA